MEIKTKFSLKDKVYYYNSEKGTIGKGQITRICLDVVDKSIKFDKYYEMNVYYEITPDINGLSRKTFFGGIFNFKKKEYFNLFKENEIFSSKEELLNVL